MKTSIRFLILAILLIGMVSIASASCAERSSIQFAGIDSEGNLRIDTTIQEDLSNIRLVDDLGNVLLEFTPIGVGTWEEYRNIEPTAGVLYVQLVNKDGVIIDKRIVENCPNIIFIRRNTDKDSVTVKARYLLPPTDGRNYVVNWRIRGPNTKTRSGSYPVPDGSDGIVAVLEEEESFFVAIVCEGETIISKTVVLKRVYEAGNFNLIEEGIRGFTAKYSKPQSGLMEKRLASELTMYEV